MFDVISTIHRDWLPHMLRGRRGREGGRKPTPKDESERLLGLGRGPSPPDTHWAHYTLPVARLELRAPNGHCVHSPASGLSPWPDDWLEGASWRFPRGLGERVKEMPAPGPSPILFASKFLSLITFWGFPQPPTPDLSWQVWVPLFLPWEGLEQDRKLGSFQSSAQGGRGLLQGMAPFWGLGMGASSAPDLHCFTPTPAQTL